MKLEIDFLNLVIKGFCPEINDMSSTICSRPINVNDYDLIFAGAQKNLGIAGLTIVIANNDLIENKAKNLPPISRYEAHAKEKSMLNTSPVFAWYVAGLVFKWILDQGGLKTMGEINKEKEKKLLLCLTSLHRFVKKRK